MPAPSLISANAVLRPIVLMLVPVSVPSVALPAIPSEAAVCPAPTSCTLSVPVPPLWSSSTSPSLPIDALTLMFVAVLIWLTTSSSVMSLDVLIVAVLPLPSVILNIPVGTPAPPLSCVRAVGSLSSAPPTLMVIVPAPTGVFARVAKPAGDRLLAGN